MLKCEILHHLILAVYNFNFISKLCNRFVAHKMLDCNLQFNFI